MSNHQSFLFSFDTNWFAFEAKKDTLVDAPVHSSFFVRDWFHREENWKKNSPESLQSFASKVTNLNLQFAIVVADLFSLFSALLLLCIYCASIQRQQKWRIEYEEKSDSEIFEGKTRTMFWADSVRNSKRAKRIMHLLSQNFCIV